MAIQNLMDTQIPTIFSTGLYNEKSFDVAMELTPKIADTMITGTTEILASIKKKEIPVAMIFAKPNEEFIAAAIIEYFDGEDGEAGNWNYSWTFNKEDVPENAKIITPYDASLASFYRAISHTKYGMIIETPNYAGELFNYLMATIKNFLNENASDSDEWGVKIDGIVQFRVVVENKEKVLSCEVDGEIKQLIKDDAAIEV